MRSWRPITGGMRHPDSRWRRARKPPCREDGERRRTSCDCGASFFVGEGIPPSEARDAGMRGGRLGKCGRQRGTLADDSSRRTAVARCHAPPDMKNGIMPFYDTSISFQIVENKEALSRKGKRQSVCLPACRDRQDKAKDHPPAGGLHIFGMQTGLSPGTPHGPGPGPAAGPWGWAGRGGRRPRGWRGSGRGAACDGRRRPAARPCCGPSASKNRWP